jgi:hypothetical protein
MQRYRKQSSQKNTAKNGEGTEKSKEIHLQGNRPAAPSSGDGGGCGRMAG